MNSVVNDPGQTPRRRFWSPGRQPDSRFVMKTVAVFAAISLPFIFRDHVQGFRRCHPNAHRTETVRNARQIALMMFEFEAEYGAFPGATTIQRIRENTGSSWQFGTKTSNECFRQLLASGIATEEGWFHVSTRENPARPDNVFKTETEALKKGECGFTYLAGAREGDNRKRPLVIAPVIQGTTRFDRKALGGFAVVLTRENSVETLPINKEGRVMLDGRDMMDPRHPVWDGHAPSIAWPDL